MKIKKSEEYDVDVLEFEPTEIEAVEAEIMPETIEELSKHKRDE